MPASGSVSFSTTNLTSVADPVMHLFRREADGDLVQVAVSDDIAWPENLNSRIDYQNGGSAGQFVLIIRAFSTGLSGTCDVWLDGQPHHIAAPVDGWFSDADWFTFAAGDRGRTAHWPGGAAAEILVSFVAPYLPLKVGDGNAPSANADISLLGVESQFLFGAPQIRDGASYTQTRSGVVWFACNDPNDSDGDGVGDLLETEIGTCPTAAPCPPYYAGKDSDKDGLFDGEEVWGVAGTAPAGQDDLDLPRWGADPRRKDMFVEFDYLTTLGAPLAVGQNPFAWIRANPGQPIGAFAGTVESWFDQVQAPYLAGPAAHVRNPDGTGGIRLHFDLGVPPLDPYAEGNFGEWPSASVQALVPDYVIACTAAISGSVTLQLNNSQFTFSADGLSPA